MFLLTVRLGLNLGQVLGLQVNAHSMEGRRKRAGTGIRSLTHTPLLGYWRDSRPLYSSFSVVLSYTGHNRNLVVVDYLPS